MPPLACAPALLVCQRPPPTTHAATPAPPPQSFVWQILQAVHHAHCNCVMHRDLKPQNILVDRSGQTLKVADFGLARSFLPPFKAYTDKVRVRFRGGGGKCRERLRWQPHRAAGAQCGSRLMPPAVAAQGSSTGYVHHTHSWLPSLATLGTCTPRW